MGHGSGKEGIEIEKGGGGREGMEMGRGDGERGGTPKHQIFPSMSFKTSNFSICEFQNIKFFHL